MHRCTICRWAVELDDVEILAVSGACICIRCYARTVGSEHLMSQELRRELIAFLATAA